MEECYFLRKGFRFFLIWWEYELDYSFHINVPIKTNYRRKSSTINAYSFAKYSSYYIFELWSALAFLSID